MNGAGERSFHPKQTMSRRGAFDNLVGDGENLPVAR